MIQTLLEHKYWSFVLRNLKRNMNIKNDNWQCCLRFVTVTCTVSTSLGSVIEKFIAFF